MADTKQEPKKERRSMRYTDAELSLIRGTFLNNDTLVNALRKHFLQFKLSKTEQAIINAFKDNKALIDILSKTFMPQIDPESPLNQLVDLWMTIDIKDKTPDVAFPHILARNIVIKYLNDCFNRLSGENSEYIFLGFEPKNMDNTLDLEIYSKLIARNTIIAHVDMQLFQLVTLAGMKDETVEDAKARLSKNSLK